MIFGIADYLDVIDFMLERAQLLLPLIPEGDDDAREMTRYHIDVLKELKCQLEAGTRSHLIPVH